MNASKYSISVNKYVMFAVVLIALIGGAYGGFYFTKQYYVNKESSEQAKSQENLICEARVQKGKTGDVKSELFIFEQSAKEEDCQKYIEYKNIPDDTETFWLGF